jgi:hypothetical protein
LRHTWHGDELSDSPTDAELRRGSAILRRLGLSPQMSNGMINQEMSPSLGCGQVARVKRWKWVQSGLLVLITTCSLDETEGRGRRSRQRVEGQYGGPE